MTTASLTFLCDCLAAALFEHYGVARLPVPVREMLANPPPDLRRDVSLTEVTFGEAIWLRLLGGQGSVFANSDLPEPERRYYMACALFTALCATAGGRRVGLPPVPNDDMPTQMDLFARRLLMAPRLLPAGWQALGPAGLAELCGVPHAVAVAHLAQSA
ncbi:MAG: hypothetical protein IT317_19960 [Anaerolineales bacterium]|nr:hypothetical protein [Anaerolineales bacterium]